MLVSRAKIFKNLAHDNATRLDYKDILELMDKITSLLVDSNHIHERHALDMCKTFAVQISLEDKHTIVSGRPRRGIKSANAIPRGTPFEPLFSLHLLQNQCPPKRSAVEAPTWRGAMVVRCVPPPTENRASTFSMTFLEYFSQCSKHDRLGLPKRQSREIERCCRCRRHRRVALMGP